MKKSIVFLVYSLGMNSVAFGSEKSASTIVSPNTVIASSTAISPSTVASPISSAFPNTVPSANSLTLRLHASSLLQQSCVGSASHRPRGTNNQSLLVAQQLQLCEKFPYQIDALHDKINNLENCDNDRAFVSQVTSTSKDFAQFFKQVEGLNTDTRQPEYKKYKAQLQEAYARFNEVRNS
jgi:hypothetical protein